MGEREGFTWKQPEVWGEIDKLVAAKWQRMKISPSDLCSDEEFIRRIYLDLDRAATNAGEGNQPFSPTSGRLAKNVTQWLIR